jgi:hypothetical protein
MIKIKNSIEKAEGQILLATLLFCFIFSAFFIGVYKSGLIYSLKERAIRSSDLTALSAGAVYGNGMQLVRLSNAILMGFAMVDLALMALAVALSSFVSLGVSAAVAVKADPHFRKIVQNLQRVLFGIGTSPIPGAYPLLIFSESLSIAEDNGLKNNWPLPAQLSWHIPFPPSPIMLFNVEDSNPLPMAVIPNMALKFRTADLFIPSLGDSGGQKKSPYYFTKRSTGERIYVPEDQVEIAVNSKNSGQMRVKKDALGAISRGQFLAVDKEIQKEAQEQAEKEFKKVSVEKIETSLGGLSSLLNGVQLDVTDEYDPPDHTVLVYSTLPTSVRDTQQASADLQCASEVSVAGTGLSAWNLSDPPYQCRLIATGPSRMAEIMNSQAQLKNLIGSNKIPPLSNIFNLNP